MSEETSCDVLIIGAGLAGATLARQLRLEQPDLDVVVLDRATRFEAGLDEPTGEEFTDYANRVLRIGPLLRKHHIAGSGTRFYFDSAGRDLPLEQMSEVGGRLPHPLPTYLVDRPALEHALAELNRASGTPVLFGVEVAPEDVTVDDEHGHRVRTDAGTFRCRWLVDAAGERSPLAALLGLVREDNRNPITAAWARFTGCVSLDDLGDRSWRGRVPHWGRASATSYFMYRGYWIWLLPLSESECSIGAVFDRRHVEPKAGSVDDLVTFLREHRALRDVLGPDAQAHDFGSRTNFARLATHQFSTRRWFLTGNASTVLDPMFATSSWLFTENNKLIGEFIKADRAGETALLPSYEHHFGIRIRSRYEKLLNKPGHYLIRGCFEAWAAWFALRSHVYYNRIVPDALEDHRVLLYFSRNHDTDCSCEADIMRGKLAGLLDTADRFIDEFVEMVDSKAAFYSCNEGHFLDSASFDQDQVLLAKVHEPRVYDREFALDQEAYARYCRTLTHRVIELNGKQWDEAGFSATFDPAWDSGQSLAELVDGATG